MEYESTEAKKLVSLLETSESQEKAYWLSRTRRAIVIWSIVFVLLALSVTFIVLGLSERSRYIDFKLHYIKYDDDEARTDIYSGMEERRATIYDTIDNIAPPDNVEGYDFTGNYYNSSNYEVVVKPESNVKESLTYENSLYMQYELGHYKLTIETGVGSTERFETPEGAVGYNKLMFITPQDLQSSSANNFVGKWLDYNDTKSVTYVGNNLLNMYSLNNAVVARDNSTASGYRVQDYDGKSNNHIYGFKTNIGGKEVQYIITEAYYVNDGEKPGDSGVTIRSTYLVEKKIGGETVLKNFANGYKPVFTKDKQGNETTVPEYEYYNGKYIYKARMENGKPLMIDITSEKDNANAFRMPGKDTVVNVWWEADDRYVVIVDTVDEYSKNVIFGNKDNATILNNYNLSYDTVGGYITDARNNGENNDWTTLLDDYRQYDIDWSNAIVIPKDIGQNNVGTLVSSYVQDYSGKLSQKGTTGNHYYPVSKLGYNRNAWEIYSKDASGNWGWKRVEYDTNINSDINKEVCILIRPVWLVESVRYIYSVDSSSGTKINVNNSLSSYPGYGSASAQTYVAMKSAMVNANDNRYLVNSNANNIEAVPVIARGGYSFVGWQIPSKYEMRYNNSIGVSNMGYADIVSSKGTTEYRNIIIEQPSIACQYVGVESLEWKVVENGDWVKATSSNASNKNLYMGEATIEESGALVYYRFYYFGTYDQLTSDTQVITKIPYGYYVRTMETSSSGEAVWKKATEMRLSPVWEIIDYHITLDYNITTTNDGVEVKSEDELLLKNNNGEYVESAYGVLYGVRDYTKPTDPDDIVKEAINDINVETGFVKVYNIGNSITLPGTAQLYRRGYTLVGYDILEKVNNGNGESVWVKNEEKSKKVSDSLGASNIKINGTDGVVKDLYGDIVFKAIWKQKEYTTETKTTPSKDDTTGNIALLQGTTNIAYSKNDKVINQSTYVALLNGSEFSFVDQSTRRNIQTSKNINANYSYQYHKSSEPVVYVRLNDYFSDSTFNINLQFSNIDCGLIGFDSFEGVITAQDLFNGIKVNNKAELNYTQSITKSVNGRDLVIATVNISIVKDETEGNVEEYYKIVFSNLSCSVKFDLSEINYNLVESNILLNPNYKDANSRIEKIKSTNFVADNWYFLSDNTSYYIGNIVEYNRVHANKIRYVITYDKASQAYRVFDMTGITKENDIYKSIKILDISYFDNALVGGFDDKYLSSAKLQSRLADISLLDRAKLSTALLSGESKESNQYASHNDNGAIKNTTTTYISLQGASYKAKVSVANDSNAYKGLFNRSEIESSYLVTNATNAKAKFTTPGPGSDEYSTKFGTYAKDGETIGFVSKIPSMYINIQLFAEKDGTTNKADDDVKYTILNKNDSALIENITATVGAGTTTYGRMLKFITNSISAYDVVNGELIVNNNDITSTYIDSLDGDKVKSRVISTYIPFTSSFIFKVEFSGKYAQFNSLSDQSEKEKYLKSMFSGLDFKSKNSNAYLVTYDNNYYIVVDLRKYGRLSEENTTYIGKGNSEKNSEKNRDKGEILANRLEIYVSNPQGILNSFNLNFNNYVVGYNLDTTNPALLTTTCGWGNIETKAEGYKNNSNIFEIYGNYAQAKGLYQGKNYEYKITLSAEYINSPISITISYKVGETTYSKTISKGQEVSLNGVDDKGDVAQGLTTTVSFVRLRPDSQEYILTINNVDATLDVSFNNIYRNMYGFSFASDDGKTVDPYLFKENGARATTKSVNDESSTTLINIRVAGKRYITIDNKTGTYSVSDVEQNFTKIEETNGKTALEILQEILLSNSKLITKNVLEKNYLIRLIYVDSADNIQTAYFITQDTENANNNLAIMFIRNTEAVTGYEVKMKVGNGFLNKLTPQSVTSPFSSYCNFNYAAEQCQLKGITDNIALEYSYSYKSNSLTINVGNGDAKTPDKPSYNSTIFTEEGNDNSRAYIIGSDQFSLVRGDKTEEVSELDWFKRLISGKKTTSEGEVSNGLIDIRDFSYSNGSKMNILYGSYLVLALTAKTGYNKTFKLILKDTAGKTLVAITYNADPASDTEGNKIYYEIDKLDDSICSAWDSEKKIQYVAVMLKDKDAINTTVDGSFTLDIVNPINVYSFKDETDSTRMGKGYEFGISYNTDGSRVTDYYKLNEKYEHGAHPMINFVLEKGYTQSDYAIDVYYNSVATTQSLIYKITSKYNTETKKYEPVITSPVTGVVMGCLVLSPKESDTWSGFRFQIGNGLDGATGEIIFKVTQDLKLNKYNLTLNAEKTEGGTLAGGIEIENLDTTKPMIATAIAGTNESFANGKNTYKFTHGNAITLTFRPHANYMKSGYIFTITIGGQVYKVKCIIIREYVVDARSQDVNAILLDENGNETTDTNITLSEEWQDDKAGDAEHMIIKLVIGDTKTTDNISISVGGMTEDTFTIIKSTGQNCPDVEITGATAEDGKYTLATTYTNVNNVLQAVINVKAEHKLKKFEIIENRYGNTAKTTTLFEFSDKQLQSIQNAGGTATPIKETSGNAYNITLSVKYGPIEGVGVNYYQCTFTFTKGLTFDAEFKTHIEMKEYVVTFNNNGIALSNDIVTIIGGAINRKTLDGSSPSLETLTEDDLAGVLTDTGYSIPAGSSLRVAMKINEKYMHAVWDDFKNWTSTEYDVGFGTETDNAIRFYYKSPNTEKVTTIWGSSSSTEDGTNVIVIEIYNVTESKTVETNFQEKSYAMTLNEPNGLTSWTCNPKYADSENNAHTYSQIESGIIKYTATLSEAYSKADLKFNVTYTKIETGETTTESAIVAKNNGDESGVANGTGASIVSVSINDKGEVIVTRYQMAHYDITVTFDAPKINKYSITLQNIADNVDVVEYTPSTDKQVHTYTLYKTDIIADSESPNFSTMGILESQGSGKYRAIIGVFTINTYGKTVYYLDEYNKYAEFTDWAKLLNMGENVQGEDSKKVVLYYEHVIDSQNIEFEFKTKNSDFGFKRLVTDNVDTSGIIKTQNKNILFSVNNGTDVACEEYYNCNIVYAKTFEPLTVSDYNKLSYNGNEGNELPSQDHSSEIGGLSVYDEKDSLLDVYNKSDGTYSLVSEYFKYSKVEFNLGAQYVDALTEEINGTKYLKSEFIKVDCGVLGTFMLHQDGEELINNKYYRYIAEFSYWTGAKITINESLLTPALYNYMLDYIASSSDEVTSCSNVNYVGYADQSVSYNELSSGEIEVVAKVKVWYYDSNKTKKMFQLAEIKVTFSGINTSYMLNNEGELNPINFGSNIKVPYGTKITVQINVLNEGAWQNFDQFNGNTLYQDRSYQIAGSPKGSWSDGSQNVTTTQFTSKTISVDDVEKQCTSNIYMIESITEDITKEFALNLHRNYYTINIPNSLAGKVSLEKDNIIEDCVHQPVSSADTLVFGYADAPKLLLDKQVSISNADYATYNKSDSGLRSGLFQLIAEDDGSSGSETIDSNNCTLDGEKYKVFVGLGNRNYSLQDNRLPANRYALTFEAKNGYEGTRKLVLTNNGTKAVTLTFYDGTAYDSAESGSITINSGLSATINIDNIVSSTAGKLYFAVTGGVVFGREFANITANIVQTFSAKYEQALGKYGVGDASNISLGEFGGKLNVSDISNTPIKRSMTVDIQVDYEKDYYFSALGINEYTTYIDTKNMSIIEGADANAISGYKLTLKDGVSTIIKLQAGDNYSRATEFVMYHKNTDDTIGTEYTISYDSDNKRWDFKTRDNQYPAYYGLDVKDKEWKWYSGTQSTLINEGNYFDSVYFTIYSITMSQNSNGNNIFEMKIALNSNFNGKTINIEIEDSQINQETLQFKADNSNDKLDHVDKMFSKIELMVWNSVGLVGNTSYGDGGSSVSDFFTTSSFTLPVDATISLHLTLAKGYYNIDKLTINGIVDAIAGDYDGNFTIGSVDYSKESHTLVYTFSNIKNFTFTFAQDLRDSYIFGVSSNDFNAYASGISTTCSKDDKYELNIINVSDKPHGNYFELVIFHTSYIAFSFTIDKSYTLSSVALSSVNETSLTSKGDGIMGCTIGSWDVSYNTVDNEVTISGAVKKGETFNIVFKKRTTEFTLNYLDSNYGIQRQQGITITYGQTIYDAISSIIPNTIGLKYIGFTINGKVGEGKTSFARAKDSNGNLIYYEYTLANFIQKAGLFAGNQEDFAFDSNQTSSKGYLSIISPTFKINNEDADNKLFDQLNGAEVGIIYSYEENAITLNYGKNSGIQDKVIKYTFGNPVNAYYLSNTNISVNEEDGTFNVAGNSDSLAFAENNAFKYIEGFQGQGQKGTYTWTRFKDKNNHILFKFGGSYAEMLQALNDIVSKNGTITITSIFEDILLSINFNNGSETLEIADVIDNQVGQERTLITSSGISYQTEYILNNNEYFYYAFGANGTKLYIGKSSGKDVLGNNANLDNIGPEYFIDYLYTRLRLGETNNNKLINDYKINDNIYWKKYSNTTTNTLNTMLTEYWTTIYSNMDLTIMKYDITIDVEMGNPIEVIFDVSEYAALSEFDSDKGDLKFTFYSGSQDVYALIRQYINDESKDQDKRNILANYFMIPDGKGGYINGNAGKASTIYCDYAVIGTTQGSGHEYLSGDTLNIDGAIANGISKITLRIDNPRGTSADNPFIIDDAYSWKKILYNNMSDNNMSGGKYFIQTADLNLTELSRSQQNGTFTGHYLGGTIDGRSVKLIRTAQDSETSDDIYPIFSSITGDSSVENVEIVGDVTNPIYHPDKNIKGDSWGSLAGKIGEGSTISKITTSGGINLNIYATCYGNIGSVVGKWDYKVSSTLFSSCIDSLTANNAIYVLNVGVKYLGGVVGLLNIVSSDEGLTFKDIVNNGTITTENVSEGDLTLRTAGVANIVLNKGSDLTFDNVANNGNDGKLMSISTQKGTVGGIANIEVLATDSSTIHFDKMVNNVNIVADCGSLSSSAIVAGVMTIVGNDNSGKTIITYDSVSNNGSITVNSNSINKAAIAGGILLQNAKIEVDEFNQTNSSKIKNSGNLSGADYSAGAMLLRTGSNVTNALNLQFENSGQVTGNKLASGGLLITENNSKSITGTINISNSTNSGNITATSLAGGIMASYYDQKSVKIGIGSTSNTTKGVINSGDISAGSGYGAGIYSVYAAQKDSSNADVSCTAEIINVKNLGFITGKYVAGIVQGVYEANTKWCINGDGTTVTLEDGTTAIKASVTSTDGVASGIAVVRRGITDQGSANNASITATTESDTTKTIATGIVAVCAWDNGVINLNSSSNSKPDRVDSVITSSGYASGVAYINGVTNGAYTACIYAACANSQDISGEIASGILVVDSDTLGNRIFDFGEGGNTTNSGSVTGTLLASGISGYVQGDKSTNGDELTNLITFNLKQDIINYYSEVTIEGITTKKTITVNPKYGNAYAAGIAVAIGGLVNQVNGRLINSKDIKIQEPEPATSCIGMAAGLVVAKYFNVTNGTNNSSALVVGDMDAIYGKEDDDGNQTITQGVLLAGCVISYGKDNVSAYNIKNLTNDCTGVGGGHAGEIIKAGIYIVGGSNYTISGNKYNGTGLTDVRESQTGVDLSHLPDDWYLSIRF